MATDGGISLKFGKTVYADVDAGIRAVIQTIQESWAAEAHVAKSALLDYLTKVAQELYERNSHPWPGATSGNTLASRTGSGAESILRSVRVTGTTWAALQGYIGGRQYLWIHEYGGTIRSNGKLLTIPLPAALGPRGTSPPFARQWKNTFVARSRAGNLIIFQKRGVAIVPLYVLRSQVQIPARLGMRATLAQEIPYFIAQAADMVVRDFLAQLSGGGSA